MKQRSKIELPHHLVDRYRDSVADPDKFRRGDDEIREIIKAGLTNFPLPENFPNDYQHTVEFRDCETRNSFGFYHLSVWHDKYYSQGIVIKTIKIIEDRIFVPRLRRK